MTDNNLSFSMEALFQQLLQRGKEQGVTQQDAYNDLVEEVIENHRAIGEIDTDDATEDMEAQLRGRWLDYQDLLQETSSEIDSL
ncbi:hypothetical protein CO174_04295 [Candidatus Uhrbacteria bacterium CG_4_9_14_3_um_filter_50_9]|uniref:Uncharacterized protein n=1 Tax=Candidatus Uhrbacteria bacterium CG_4_9_14_3_um_filter_50_9 TaxID=1975035 RepID=A0A2M7XBG6_9BACT|nr:MAG: hypothetical protein CO174_04295 [Candidatus Uhrbacteria bacterium CG_4_9_14_3_um_filter_50_9]